MSETSITNKKSNIISIYRSYLTALWLSSRHPARFPLGRSVFKSLSELLKLSQLSILPRSVKRALVFKGKTGAPPYPTPEMPNKGRRLHSTIDRSSLCRPWNVTTCARLTTVSSEVDFVYIVIWNKPGLGYQRRAAVTLLKARISFLTLQEQCVFFKVPR